MNSLFNVDKENSLYFKFSSFWSSIIIGLVVLTFVLSDWIIFYSSFGDFILAFAVLLLVILKQVYFTKRQLYFLAIPFIIIFLHVILTVLFNDYWYNNQILFLSIIKFLFYNVSVFLIFNFVKQNNLEIKFLKINNVIALLVILLGIIITISIYLEIPEFYNTIWSFTRTDINSYFFYSNRDIVRMRSIFSEPAHLGYYLNITFFSNLFYKKKKNNIFLLSVVALGILLTLSYSMIGILVIISLIYAFINIIKGKFKWNNWYIAVMVAMIVFIFVFWDFIYVTIIERTLNILQGNDSSAYNRIVESWIYVTRERLLFGNGIGHTPPITNIYAYFLSDLGLIGLIPYLVFTGLLFYNSIATGILFVLMNITKGGYLNPAFWMFLLYILVFCLKNQKTLRGSKDV